MDSGIKNYIQVRSDGCILDLWSDAFLPERDTSSAICINENGTYIPTLFPDREWEGGLRNDMNVPLYRWNGMVVVERTQAEIDEELSSRPAPDPSEQDDIESMLVDHEYRLTLIELGLD